MSPSVQHKKEWSILNIIVSTMLDVFSSPKCNFVKTMFLIFDHYNTKKSIKLDAILIKSICIIGWNMSEEVINLSFIIFFN